MIEDNLTTENDAAEQMLCPFKFHRDNDKNTCEGSYCMAWRTTDYQDRHMPLGFCGLVGKPE